MRHEAAKRRSGEQAHADTTTKENTNTNYNSAAEAEAGLYGMRAIARYLGDELKKTVQPQKPRLVVAS